MQDAAHVMYSALAIKQLHQICIVTACKTVNYTCKLKHVIYLFLLLILVHFFEKFLQLFRWTYYLFLGFTCNIKRLKRRCGLCQIFWNPRECNVHVCRSKTYANVFIDNRNIKLYRAINSGKIVPKHIRDY